VVNEALEALEEALIVIWYPGLVLYGQRPTIVRDKQEGVAL
jgi:hypothetical protein